METEPTENLTRHQRAQAFFTKFTEAKRNLLGALESLESVDKSCVSAGIDELWQDFQNLQKLVTDSTSFLPAYDIRSSQESLKELRSSLQTVQDKFAPKKKFAFKSKSSTSAVSKEETVVKNPEKYVDSFNLLQISYKNKTNEDIQINNNEVLHKDLELEHLYSCKIYIYGAPATVYISNLKDCQIFSGPVTTSIFVENCQDCSFTLACQQLRIHTTTNSTFHLHVTSRSIIENSKDIKFAPYNWEYDGLQQHFEFSTLDKTVNNWKVVDDFDWLASNAPSPNWCLLDLESAS